MARARGPRVSQDEGEFCASVCVCVCVCVCMCVCGCTRERFPAPDIGIQIRLEGLGFFITACLSSLFRCTEARE